MKVSAGALAGCALLGCSDPSPPDELVFEKDVRSAYSLVRDCRSPGEHSGLDAFTVWISPAAVPEFAKLWTDPPSISRLPAGTVVVKEVYRGTACDPGQVDHWVAMRKEPGFDPEHADWHWQHATSDRLLDDGAAPACIDCHSGQASCSGYGETAGRDYVCTAP